MQIAHLISVVPLVSPGQLGQQQEAVKKRLAACCPQHRWLVQSQQVVQTLGLKTQLQAPSLACFVLLMHAWLAAAPHALCKRKQNAV